MFVRSILWSLKDIEASLKRLDREPNLHGREVTIDLSNRARITVHELVELLRCGEIHRPSNPAERHDDSITVLLSEMYSQQSAQIAVVSNRLPEGQKTIEALESTGQVEMKHSEVFIPLHGASAARNWPPTLVWLVSELETLIDDSHGLTQMLCAGGAEMDSTELILAQSLFERLETLQKVLRAVLSRLQFINNTVPISSDIDQFLRSTVPQAFTIETYPEERLP